MTYDNTITPEQRGWIRVNMYRQDLTLNFEWQFDVTPSEAERIVDQVLDEIENEEA